MIVHDPDQPDSPYDDGEWDDVADEDVCHNCGAACDGGNTCYRCGCGDPADTGEFCHGCGDALAEGDDGTLVCPSSLCTGNRCTTYIPNVEAER
jgi:hypothetical protein